MIQHLPAAGVMAATLKEYFSVHIDTIRINYVAECKPIEFDGFGGIIKPPSKRNLRTVMGISGNSQVKVVSSIKRS